MKPYPSYKPSGIEWIGDIPSHWEVKRFKYLYASSMGATILKTDLVVDGKIPVYSATEEDDIFGYVDETNVVLDKGDLVIPARGNSIGHVTKVDGISTCTQTTIYAKRISSSFNENFVFYFLKGFREQLFQFDRTAIPQITVAQVKENFIVLPPKSEQTAIARFLDEKTAQIDKLVANKQRLIELLKEERTAIINECLNCDSPDFHDEHDKGKGKSKNHGNHINHKNHSADKWERKKLKYVAMVNPTKKNYTFNKESEDEVVFLPMEKVSEDGNINQDSRKKISDVSTGFTYFERGDIIVAKITPCFENGKGALLENLNTDFGFGSTEFHTIRASEKVTKEFLYYQTKSDKFMQVGEAFMTGSAGQKRVPSNFVQDFLVPLPTIEEQTAIVHHIQTETQRIDATISKVEKEIELLQEYRTALISEVVTGKVKVV